MRLDPFFSALDARPFRPFVLELMNGRKLRVRHPENVFVIPNRQAVYQIVVCDPGGWMSALIWPDGINAILFNGKKARSK